LSKKGKKKKKQKKSFASGESPVNSGGTASRQGKNWQEAIRRVSDFKIEIPRDFRDDMRVPGIIFTDTHDMGTLLGDQAPVQVINVATLPGIIEYSLAMPDIHYGYGFPIGGVAAMSVSDGVISPGGVGFDINCGVRLLNTTLAREDVLKQADMLCAEIFSSVPCGVGSRGDIRVGRDEMEKLLSNGAQWAVKKGLGWEEDIELCEERGRLEVDNIDGVSNHARERGKDQLGTLGSGNHFIEVQYVDRVYDDLAARAMGLEEGLAAVMIHSGSRGLGAQVCQDSIRVMREAAARYGYELPDRQLACAPVGSPEGKEYYSAMCAAANYAWANRHCLAHRVRGAFERVFGTPAERIGLHLVYDVAHNIAKMETHEVAGKKIDTCVHRKGATRAFPARHPDVPDRYAALGQPVIVPGDMGRASYVMLGTEQAMAETWGSICHGAGRVKSRSGAKASFKAKDIIEDLQKRHVVIHAKSKRVIVEEAPEAYKNVSDVVETCVRAGIAKKVARLRPMAVVKG